MNKKVKERKYQIIIFLLLLVISIGYAVLTTSVNISGVSKIQNPTWDIHFENVVINNNSVTIVPENNDKAASIDLNDNTKVSFAVTLDKPGDFYEFTVDAVNDGSIDGMVDTVVSLLNNQPITTLPNYLNYSVVHDNGTPIEKNHLLAANSSETYKVRVEYSRDIGNDEVVEEEVNLVFDFTINYKQADGSATGFINYRVVHRYQNLDLTTYTEAIENLKGIAGAHVSPSVAERHGFVSPEVQTATIDADGSTEIIYVYSREKYNLNLTDSEYIETTTPSGEYYYETPITLTAKARSGYTFDHWSNDLTTNQITFDLDDDTTIGPIYLKDVLEIILNANGGSVDSSSINVNRGSAIGTLPVPIRTGYYTEGWFTGISTGVLVEDDYVPVDDIELFARWKKSVESAIITNSSISIQEGENTNIVISNAAEIEEEYTFTSNNTSIATVDSNGTVIGVSVGTTTITITGVNSNQSKTVDVEILSAITHYVVNYNANGGTVDPLFVNVEIGEAIGELPEPVYPNHIFEGWYSSLTDGVLLDSNFVPTSDTEIFAKWKKLICVRAMTLHTDQCERASDGCGDLGYGAGGSQGTSTITFGRITTGNYDYGNAYNCDVNGDDIYDDTTERFYYLGSNGDNASLIYYSNFEGDEGTSKVHNFNYETAQGMFPTSTQWSGVNVSFGDKAARFPTLDEVATACNVPSEVGETGQLDACLFLFENTRFLSVTNGRSGIWLDNSNSTNRYYRIFAPRRHIVDVATESLNVVKPVIEVSKDYIDNSIDPSLVKTITFDPKNGTTIPSKQVVLNTPVGNMEVPEIINYIFDGWFTDESYTTKVLSTTLVTGNMDLVAKWTRMDGVCLVGDDDYGTLDLCLSAVPNNIKSNITLIANINSKITISDKKNVVIDLDGHIISSSNSNAVVNNGIVEFRNGTISSSANSATINNNINATLILNGVDVFNTADRQALYNNGGSVEVNNNSYLRSSSSSKATIHNLNSGSVNVLGGVVESLNNLGIYNESGTLTIGKDDSFINSTTPVIQGYTYGVSGESYSFYDGIIKGIDGAVDDESVITIDPNSRFKRGTEEIDYNTYNTLTLENIDYQVSFNANGGTVSPAFIIVDRGDAVGTLPVPIREGYYLDGWYTSLQSGIKVDSTYEPTGDIELFAIWKMSIESAAISNSSIILETGNEETIDITNASSIEEQYSFTSNDTSVATVDSTGKVVGVSEGTTTITILGLSSNKYKTVNVRVANQAVTFYQVTLNANGGIVNPLSINVNIGDAIGTIPTPVYTNHIFEGWYSSLTDGVLIDSSYTPVGDVEIFAKWKKIVCIKASTLHSEECQRTTDGCGAAGYTLNGSKGSTTIDYGRISMGTYEYGNAYNCDVNDDDYYDEVDERFYYLGSNNNNAVMIFFSNFEGDDGIAINNIFPYSTASTKLPTLTQWSGLPVVFGDRAARFATFNEIATACGGAENVTTVGALDDCVFLLENSRFISDSNGRSAIWLSYSDANNKYYRIHTSNRNIATIASTSNNVVRPVIEVPTNLIDNYVDSSNIVTVSFNVQGGSPVQSKTLAIGSPVGDLPTTTKTDYVFEGWYTDTSYNTPVTINTIVTGTMSIVAKWREIDGVCIVNGRDYNTISGCVGAAPNNTRTIIKVLKDLDTNLSIGSNKNVLIDLNGHTWEYNSNSVISNSGVLELKNGTINCSAEYGAINNNSTGNLKIYDLEIYATGTRQGIYNNGGTLEIGNGCYISSTTDVRATVHNLNNGTLSILGGTIISENQQAVYNEAGTLTIGEDDSYVNSSTPVLQGYTYGVTGAAYSFYDGIIKGYDGAVENEGVITKDSNSEFVRSSELINSDLYSTLSLSSSLNNYRINFNPNGGTVSPSYKVINAGSSIGSLPTPSNDNLTFEGWYTGLTNGVKIDENETPTGSVTYYARWS